MGRFPIAVTCQELEVSYSTYFEVISRGTSFREAEDRELTGLIVEIHEDYRGTYVTHRVHAELWMGLGLRISCERVALRKRWAGILVVDQRRMRRHCPDTVTGEELR